MNINELGVMAVSSQVYSVRSLSRIPFYKILLENPMEIYDLISSHDYEWVGYYGCEFLSFKC